MTSRQIYDKYQQDKLALWMSYGGSNYLTGEAGQISGSAAVEFGQKLEALEEQFLIDYQAAIAAETAAKLAAQKLAAAAEAEKRRLIEEQIAAQEAAEAEQRAIEEARQAAANLEAGKQILLTGYQQGIVSSDIVQKAIDNGIIEKPAGFVHTPSVEIETTGVPTATPNVYPIPKKNTSLVFSLILIGVGAYIIFKD